MVKIASQHEWKDKEYRPLCRWPKDFTVQWGSGGLVISGKKSSYVTAFFEAFSDRPGCGFIRGEGASIEEAERKCFKAFKKYNACDHPEWGRRGYRNGGGRCLKCGAFQGSVFKEMFVIGQWRKPLTMWEADSLAFAEKRKKDLDSEKYLRLCRLRKKLFGVKEYNF